MSIKKVTINPRETKYEVSVRLGGRGSKRLRRRFDRRSDAEAFLFEFNRRKDDLMKSGTGAKNFEETTFTRESGYWLSIQRQVISPSHLKRVEGILRELLPRIGSLSPNKLHPGMLTTIQSELLAEGSRPATVNRKMEVITSVLNFASKKRRIPSNPAVGFEKLKETRDDISSWDQKEAESFLAFALKKYPEASEMHWVFVAYLCAMNTGLRAGELWGLQPRDLIHDGEILHIQRQFDRVEKDFRPTKGRSNRRVPCNEGLRMKLLRRIEIYGLSKEEPIFFWERGRPICHDSFADRRFDKDVREWGGKRIRFHDLRHTAITLMIASGLDLRTVQDIGGHKDIHTTMNYAHLLAEKIREAARTFSIVPQSEGDLPTPKTHLRLIKNS